MGTIAQIDREEARKAHDSGSVVERLVRPQDGRGRFVSSECPKCGGNLKLEGNEPFLEWRCDGLVDPGMSHQPLKACSYSRSHLAD